jgi:hypothetical protein
VRHHNPSYVGFYARNRQLCRCETETVMPLRDRDSYATARHTESYASARHNNYATARHQQLCHCQTQKVMPLPDTKGMPLSGTNSYATARHRKLCHCQAPHMWYNCIPEEQTRTPPRVSSCRSTRRQINVTEQMLATGMRPVQITFPARFFIIYKFL